MMVDHVPTLVRAMGGADAGKTSAALGGLANVFWLPDVSPDKIVVEADAILNAQELRENACVFVAGAADQYVAESYSPARAPIQFCGHGALAAAWVIFSQVEPDAQRIAFRNHQHSWQARCGDFGIADIALTYSRPLPVECAVPEFAATSLGDEPLAAAEVGTESDYLILEFADAETVKGLRPDFTSISAATERALIVTARLPLGTKLSDESPADDADEQSPGCVFRYFAPQYGQPEDAATGSAAVQLAAYWSPRLHAAQFMAHQLSPQGARMRLGCSDSTVELAARVGYG